MESRWERMFMVYCLFLIIAMPFLFRNAYVSVRAFPFCIIKEAEFSVLRIDFVVFNTGYKKKLEHLLCQEFYFIDAK